MADLIISKVNEVYLHIEADPLICYELRDTFSFEVPGAQFSPSYRNHHWDGMIRLFSPQSKQIYAGLLDRVIAFCRHYNYSYKFRKNKFYGLPYEENNDVSKMGIRSWLDRICTLTPYDYQIAAIYEALRGNRKLILSPTGSGKSLMMYALVSYYFQKGERILVVVHKTSLVEQLYKEFIGYGFRDKEGEKCDLNDYCVRMYGRRKKDNPEGLCHDKEITITTWQSIYKLPKSSFEKFGVIIGDEAHTFKSSSLVSVMTKLCDAKYRFGFTGTLDGTKTHRWVTEGLFGPSYVPTTTKEMIEASQAAQIRIRILLLKHTPQRIATYQDEIKYLISHEGRNQVICNLTTKLEGNNLILTDRVDSHAKVLYNYINNSVEEGRKVFIVHGGVVTEDREEIRAIVEEESNAIIIASFGVFSTGINIKNLHNLILATPSKGRIKNLQSIGRIIRKSSTKSKATVYDIADDITYKGKANYTLNHLTDRIKIYNEEGHEYDFHSIKLQD